MTHNNDDNLYVNILSSLKTISDLKWALKPFTIEKCTLESQDTYSLNIQKKKLLEQSIKLAIQKVGYVINNLLTFV